MFKTQVHELTDLIETVNENIFNALPTYVERQAMTEEEKMQTDEWQEQLRQQEEEEEERIKQQ